MSDPTVRRPRCGHCPLGAEGEAICPGQRNLRVCVRADPASAEHAPGVIPHILGLAPAPAGAGVPPPAAPAPAAAASPHLARHLLILGCDYRTDALDECGCTGRKHCGLRKGAFASEPWAVSYSDCLTCVSPQNRI